MPKGLGPRMNTGFKLSPVSRPAPQKAFGLYPGKGSGAGEYGSVQFPSAIEAYNRESDYRRWKLGQALYLGSGRSWADKQVYSLSRFIGGAVDATSKDIVTLYPSAISPERVWYAAMRVRGSIILPQPIRSSAITVNTSDSNPANHTLTYNVSGVLTAAQVGVFSLFIGDQFEDSASSASYPSGLISRPVGSVALTLVAANPGSLTLVFDISRPEGRIEKNGNIYWNKLPYLASSPTSWRSDGSRFLCSSTKLFCCCPDHLGGALANIDTPKGRGTLDEFPLPNANRSVRSPWERQGAGYYRQWRSLSPRIDDRRECKHMHALRWQCGIPWFEPSDYPTQEERELLEFARGSEGTYSQATLSEYQALRELTYDRYVLSLAEVIGLELFPGSDVREAVRSDQRPMLWNDGEQPLASWCRQNDWWMERGTRNLKIFNASTNSFDATITVAGTGYPLVQEVAEGSSGAPIIIP